MAETLYIPENASRKEVYDSIIPQVEGLLSGETDQTANLANFAAALREAFGFFWVGFYLKKENQLVLGPFQGPIACTRINFDKGVCGYCYRTKETVIVPNVEEFPGHIACSSASKSEIVVPVFDKNGDVSMVLDVDSDKLDDFSEVDKEGLKAFSKNFRKHFYRLKMNTLFPIFLKLEELKTLVVGGGNVGLEKLEAIFRNSPKATVTLVSPEIREEIKALVSHHNLTLIFEKYHISHLEGIDIVTAGTDSKEVNRQVRDDCKAKRILVNIADTPDLCDFYLSSVVVKEDLKIAISTNGKSPTFAKRFREILEEIIPENLQETLNNLQAIRNKLKGDFQSKVQKLNEITKVMQE